MKLIGSYTSPFVRKISVLLLEKGITFEFINELPYEADNGVAQYNPLGKVPALVTEKGSTGSIRRSSRNILNCWISRQRCSRVTRWQRLKFASLKRWLTALWMQRWCLYANRRARRRNNRKRNCCASGKNQPQPGYARKLSERRDAKTDTVNLATIAIACAVGYLNFRRVAPGWCVSRPHRSNWSKRFFNAKALPAPKRQRLDAHYVRLSKLTLQSPYVDIPLPPRGPPTAAFS